MRQASTSNGLAYLDREDDEETRRKSIYIYIFRKRNFLFISHRIDLHFVQDMYNTVPLWQSGVLGNSSLRN